MPEGIGFGGVPALNFDADNGFGFGVVGNPLLPGRYRVHIDVFDYTGAKLTDSWNDALEFAVRSPRGEIGQGLVDLPVEFTFE